jgi:hypothetical protein
MMEKVDSSYFLSELEVVLLRSSFLLHRALKYNSFYSKLLISNHLNAFLFKV